MKNPRLAGRYAKSLFDLATEKGLQDKVYADMKMLQNMNKSNPDFVSVLVSPVIKADKKVKIIDAVLSGKVNELTSAFTRLLAQKGRENSLPEIANAFVEQYNTTKGIHQVKITTAVPMSEDLQKALVEKIKANTELKNIELHTAVEDELIGGFVLEMENSIVDASILRDLKDVRKQFLNNDYIHKIR